MSKRRDSYIKFIKEMIEESPGMKFGKPHEVIYRIDGINVYGEFCDGVRGVDHNCLKGSCYSWEDVLSFGTISVPETKIYISSKPIKFFEDLGFEKMLER